MTPDDQTGLAIAKFVLLITVVIGGYRGRHFVDSLINRDAERMQRDRKLGLRRPPPWATRDDPPKD